MKVCINCSRVNPDDAEECIECGEVEFEEFLNPPFYDDAEWWTEEN